MTEKLTVETHGIAAHAMNCPLRVREWHGIPYANIVDDCFNCQFFKGCEGSKENTHAFIFCSAKKEQ